MSLSKDSYPASFLSTQMKHGYLIKIDGLWHLRDGKKEAPRAHSQPPVDPITGEFRCALWSDGELQLARGEQIALRLSAAEVGHLRSYLAGGRAA
jgi:predicted deacetylase